MTSTLPLVRAGATGPILVWHRSRGIDAEPLLQAAGLPLDLHVDPQRPIPLRAGLRFLVLATRSQGPDFGFVAVSERSVADLGPLGQVLRLAATPREAIGRAVRAFTHHGSHEQFTFTRSPGGGVVRYAMRVPVDDETLHAVHLYVAALVRALAGGTAHRGPRVAGIAILPHPVHGLAHVQALFSGRVVAATGRALELTLTDDALDQPYLGPARERETAILPDGWAAIRGDGTLAHSIRAVLPDLLASGDCAAAQVADLAFMSTRTLQRRLAAEGTHLTRLIDEARRARALEGLAEGDAPIEAVSAQLGYSAASSFTRAVRRWTGRPPRDLRGA